jgi:hypothetical protein
MTKISAFERRCDLNANGVIDVVETTLIAVVCARNPALPDSGDKRVAFTDAPGKDFDPIQSEVDVVDIEKDIFALKRAAKRSHIARAAKAESSRR